MALFSGYKRINGSRSNTQLIKSGHASPAEEWVLDPKFRSSELSSVFANDGALFYYLYGGDGYTDVVIPKGRIVGVTTPIKDFVSKKMKTAMTLPGMATDNNTIGVVPYNICKDYFQMDKFGGNQPSIITMDYIKLPYIPSVAASTKYNVQGVIEEEKALSVDLKMPWGAAIGTGIKEGEYLKSSPSGRFCLWNKATDNFCEVVGQVLAVDFNQEQWGWEKWMLWDESAKKQDDAWMNRSGASNLPSDDGYPFDPKYADGDTNFQFYQNKYITDPTGIPGLHDGSGEYAGYGYNDTEYTDIELGTIPANAKDGTIMALQAKDYAGGKMNKLQAGVVIKIGDTVVDPKNYTINYELGMINLTVSAADAGKTVTGTYKSMHFGTPTYLDFKGVVGAVYVLLKK